MRSLSLLCLFVLCLTQGLARTTSKTKTETNLVGNATLDELTIKTIRPPTIMDNSDDIDSNWVEFDVYGGEGGNFGGITIGHTAAVAGLTGDQPYIRIRADGAYSYMVENTSPGAEWAQSIGVYDGLDKLGNMGFCGIGPNFDYMSWGFKEIGGGGVSWWNGQSVITLWKSGRIQFMQPMEGDGTNVRTSASEPTAYMVLAKGSETPSSAPLKFVAGTKLETPEAGAVEFDGSSLYITDDNSTRQTVSTLEANQTFTGANTFTNDIEVSGPVSGIVLTSPNGSKFRITVNDDGTLSTTAV